MKKNIAFALVFFLLSCSIPKKIINQNIDKPKQENLAVSDLKNKKEIPKNELDESVIQPLKKKKIVLNNFSNKKINKDVKSTKRDKNLNYKKAFISKDSSSSSNPQIAINFDDADLYEVVRTLAEILKINYILDPAIQGKVTIHSAGHLDKKDIFPLFFQILEVNGLTTIQEENLYKIIKVKEAPRMPISIRYGNEGKDIPYNERVIIQIILLNYISVQEVTKLITPFLSSDGTIVEHPDSNHLLVIDKQIIIQKILNLIKVFDISGLDRFSHRFYRLENVNVEETVKTLNEIFNVYGENNLYGLKFVAINRMNTVLAIGKNAKMFDQIDGFIKVLDVPSTEVEPKIFVYSVKNGVSTQLSQLLNEIFGMVTESISEKTTLSKSIDKDKDSKSGDSQKQSAPKIISTPFGQINEDSQKKDNVKKTIKIGDSQIEGTLKGKIKVTADEVRNALIIAAIPSDYKIIEGILKKIDIQPRQVLIEVTVAEISLDKSTSLGIEWSYLKKTGGPLDTDLLNAGIGSGGLRFTIGQADRWTSILSALASEKKVNILSSPSVLASDNKEAKIEISNEIPVASAEYKYQTGADAVLTTNIQYRNTGVILSVTPHINERGLVSMDVNQEVSEQASPVQVGGKDYPSFYKRSINTRLTVKDNQTIVIGGLIKETKSDGNIGVPWFNKIPILGPLFTKITGEKSKTELILFITPRVIISLEDVDSVTEEYKNKVGNVLKKLKNKH